MGDALSSTAVITEATHGRVMGRGKVWLLHAFLGCFMILASYRRKVKGTAGEVPSFRKFDVFIVTWLLAEWLLSEILSKMFWLSKPERCSACEYVYQHLSAATFGPPAVEGPGMEGSPRTHPEPPVLLGADKLSFSLLRSLPRGHERGLSLSCGEKHK